VDECKPLRGGGAGIDYAQAVAVDGAGGVVAAGNFDSSSATFGTMVVSSFVTSAEYNHQAAFVWKLSAEGTTLWAVSGGGMDEGSFDSMTGVAVDGSGDIVAAGYFSSPTVTFGTTVLASAGVSDAVVWKLGATGSTVWAVRGGGTSSDNMLGMTVDSAGGVVAVGQGLTLVHYFELNLSRICH